MPYDSSDLRSQLTATRTEARPTGACYAPQYFEYLHLEPDAVTALGTRSWIARSQNCCVVFSLAQPGDGLGESIAATTIRLNLSNPDPGVMEHLRATLGTRWVDVASTDRHTVKPWLSARLGFSPAVPDLSDQGFELIGGRLDVLDAKPVATLVYQRRQHMISVFVWPGESVAPRDPIERRGYHLVRFVRSGMTYWAVSDLNTNELEDLARLIASSS